MKCRIKRVTSRDRKFSMIWSRTTMPKKFKKAISIDYATLNDSAGGESVRNFVLWRSSYPFKPLGSHDLHTHIHAIKLCIESCLKRNHESGEEQLNKACNKYSHVGSIHTLAWRHGIAWISQSRFSIDFDYFIQCFRWKYLVMINIISWHILKHMGICEMKTPSLTMFSNVHVVVQEIKYIKNIIPWVEPWLRV